MKKCRLIILLSIVFMLSASCVNSEEGKSNTWIPIASFKVGNGETEIPNQDEIGGGYTSPSNFFCYNNNFYIFVGGTKLIKKISLDGKIISNIKLDDYPFFTKIFLDKTSSNVFALGRTEIYVFDINFQLLGTIDLYDMLKNEKTRVNNIEVYNDYIYLYLDVSSDLYIVNYQSSLNKNVKYSKDRYLALNNTFIRKTNKNLPIKLNENKIILITNDNTQKEIKIPNNVGFVSFKSYTEQNLYFLGLSLAEGVITYYKLIVIDKQYNCSSFKLKDSEIIYGSSDPLLDLYKGNIFQLVFESNKFYIYKIVK